MAKNRVIKNLLTAIAVWASTSLWAQQPEQDCFNAIPVCQNSFNQPNSYVGQGTGSNEINNSSSCLGAGELNSVWYIITVQNSGNLGFNITPNDPTNDYDWAVFNLTNASCADIFTDPTLEVSCNFSGSTFPVATTGPNGGSNLQDEALIPVNVGETYAICVSNFSPTNQDGYTLDFGISTAQVFDNTAPTVNGVSLPIACGSTQMTFSFSENVLCSSISTGDFQLIDPSGNVVNITAVSGAACQAGGAFEDEFILTVNPPLTTSGQYSLNLIGPVTDNCQNAAAFPATYNFNLNAVTAGISVTDEFCGNNAGQIELTNISGGTPPYTIIWDDPAQQTTDIATGLGEGTYTATITDQNGCQAVLQGTVADPLAFTIQVTSQNDTCSQGLGKATAITIGGSGNFTYSWSPGGQTTATAITLPPNIYTVTVSDATNAGCQAQGTVTILNINDVKADFVAQPAVMSYLEPSTIFKNLSINANSYLWDFGDYFTSFDTDPSHTYPPTPGIYNVTLIATSNRGCTDTIMRTVRIDYDLNFYVPSAFTPNGDLVNEEFMVYSDGINYNDFEMQIFDRWGHQVFATTNPFEKWNGAYFNDGEILAEGVYVYRVRFKQLYDVTEHSFTGKIVLLK